MRIARSPLPSPEDLQWLRKHASSAIAPKRLAERCRIVLLSAEGKNHEQIAAALGIIWRRHCLVTVNPMLPERPTPMWELH